jgi:L-cystine uptake protein TcyP (sodium:dicarboxylate symporter family)
MNITILNLIFLLFSIGFIYWLRKRKHQLGFVILISLSLGIFSGFLLKLSPNNSLLEMIKNGLHLIGYGYLALLKMLVIPLILTSIIHAILNLGYSNGDSIKKISFITCGMLLGMTALSSLIGIVVGMQFSVGQGLSLPDYVEIPKHNYSGLANTLLAMLPSNPVAMMTQENTIAVVIFAALLGIAARMLDLNDHDKMDTFKKLITSLFVIVKKLAQIILSLTPYGILALLTLLIFNQGITLFIGMINFIAAMYTAMLLVIIMHTIIVLGLKRNPWYYFKNAYVPLFVAFTTRSSFGTLPITEETLRNKFKTKQTIATFVPSIGSTIGMNACAGIFPAMLVVMTLHILNQPMTGHMIIMVMFINAIASLGISGIPGTAYIAATVTLTSLNLPYTIVALVQGVDPIVDMGRTATNVNGVMVTALVVDKMNGHQGKSAEQLDILQ